MLWNADSPPSSRRFARLLGTLLLLFGGLPLRAQSVAVYYDGIPRSSEAFKSARYIGRMLHHVGVESPEVRPVGDYQAGSLGDLEAVFLVFEEGAPSASIDLLQDLAETETRIVWLHSHIDGLLEHAPDRWGIRFDRGLEHGNWIIRYGGEEFPKRDPWLNIVDIEEPEGVSVLSWVEDDEGERYPYVLRSGNLWYFADCPFSYAVEGGRFLILADLLHDIFGVEHAREHRALVRIEDVNPDSSPAALRRVTDYLHRQGVPFQISLIPIYRNPSLQYEVSLSDRPELVDVLKYADSRGATLVLHGLTHQHHGGTGEDYEFWDDIAGRPIPHESSDWVDQRVRRGIALCARNGLYPLAWETPHYSGSQEDYRTIAGYFTTFNDRLMAAELSGTQQIFPYPVRIPGLGLTVVPENLGYLPMENPDPDVLIMNARNMRVVRDGVASFFFHPFVPLKHLKKVVKAMKKMGWTFISIREFDCRVRTGSLWAGTVSEQIQLRMENQYVHERVVNAEGKTLRDVYSSQRQTGILSRSIDIPAGGYGVLETVDMLPEEPEGGLLKKISTGIGRWLGRKPEKPPLILTRAVVLTDSSADSREALDQESFASVLEVFGFSPLIRDRRELPELFLRPSDLLVVPHAAARSLDRRELNSVLDFVAGGGRLVADGRSQLADALGIRFEGPPRIVREVKDLSLPAPDLQWDPPVSVQPFSSRSELILARDAAGDTALAAVHPFRKGKVLFFGTLFDPQSSFGITRYPYLPYYLRNSLGIAFNARRNNLEFYFDPGLRQNTSWEKLVKRWKAGGVKIVYLAAWHFYRDYQFDYRYFIGLCHDFGIAVYAWFELPQVTPLFWEEHPEWREKTLSGSDARPHWRLLMNLYHPAARAAARRWVAEMLSRYDWDGVNLAELNFDTNRGREDPARFTPMNREIRLAFRGREGFDPASLFDPDSPRHWRTDPQGMERFLSFRAEIVRDLHADFLETIFEIVHAGDKSMEVIVTAMDSLVHSEIFEECGIDTRDVIRLMDRFPFTLQIEDPARSWGGAPDRYRTYFETYRDHVSDPRRLMFDINLIASRDIAGRNLPAAVATGTELAATVYHAARHSGRVGIYSESTIHALDMDLLPYVMSADVRLREQKRGYGVVAASPFILTVSDLRRDVLIDGRRWPFFGTAGIAVPSGSHHLSFGEDSGRGFRRLAPRILLDADIRELTVSGHTYSLSYASPIPASLTFSRPPAEVTLDGEPVSLSGSALGVILPRGEHRLEIVTGSTSFEAIEEAGYLSSSAFYVLGLASVLLLAAFYLIVRVKA